jgi:hypothetical protein
MKWHKRMAIVLAGALLVLCLSGCGGSKTEQAAKKAAATYDTGSIGYGDEWLAVCLSDWDYGVGDGWKAAYDEAVTQAVEACGGVLSDKMYTKYDAVILGLTAAGYDATDVSGYDLTKPLSDYDSTVAQGLNGAAYALLALDCGSYSNDIRDEYVDYILSRQLQDGGFAFSGDNADPDLTSMALQALAQYTSRSDVSAAVDKAVSCLSGLQQDDGGYSSWGTVNCESCAQVIIAMCQLGIGTDDARFIKNGRSVLDKLLSYQLSDGTFSHLEGGESDQTATIQALTALTALLKFQNGGKGLFTGGDTCSLTIRCDTLLNNLDKLSAAKQALVPEDGVLLPEERVPFEEGQTVFDVLKKELQSRNMQFEFEDTALNGPGYIDGICNLYEFDCGDLSGWMYSVNDTFPSVSCAKYTLSDGDKIIWAYSCDLGADIGDTYMGS